MLALKATLLHLELNSDYSTAQKVEINFKFEPKTSTTFAHGIIRMSFFVIVEPGEKTDLRIGKVVAFESTRLIGGCKIVNSQVKIRFIFFGSDRDRRKLA